MTCQLEVARLNQANEELKGKLRASERRVFEAESSKEGGDVNLAALYLNERQITHLTEAQPVLESYDRREKKYTPKVFSVPKTQAPQQAEKRFGSETLEPLRNTANGIFQRKNLWIFHPGGC